MSDNLDTRFLSDILLNFAYYREIFNLKPGSNFLVVSVDDIFGKIYISNKLYEILSHSDIIKEEFQTVSVGDELFKFQNITEFIFKTLINDSVQYYVAGDYPTNILVRIPDSEIAIQTIKTLCLELNLSCAIYDMYSRKNFEPINLNVHNKSKNPHSFLNVRLENGKTKAENWNIKVNKLFVNAFKQRGWTNWNRTEINMLNYVKIMKFRWYKLLLPIAIFDNSINVPFMNRFIWKEVKEKFNLEIDLTILYKCLKIHPLQLAGVTNHVIFGHELIGSEDWAHNFDEIFANNVMQWTRPFATNLCQEICRLIHFQYNYLGDNIFENILRNILIYNDAQTLQVYDFPNQMPQLDMLTGANLNKDLNQIWETTLNNYDNAKDPFVLKYLNII